MRLHLKTAIWATGKTQRRVAADSCMSENRLSEIICGWVTPSGDEKLRLARTLDRDPKTLFNEDKNTAVA